jgi:Sulfotransferase domain
MTGDAPSPPTLRINMWSGPRNISTALMYAFAQRGDTRVVDEPLYAHYLRLTGAEHPGRREVLAAMENDGERVVRDVVLGPCDRPVLFLKQMAHHLLELDHGFLERTANVLLVRDPREVLLSLRHQIPEPTLRDTAFAAQTELLDELLELGQDPAVLDARLLLLDPPGVLAELCARLGLEFDPSMLSWAAGARSEDGVWAPHWYRNVHRSTGFRPYRPNDTPLPAELEPLFDECRPHYARLLERALGARGAAGGGTGPLESG